MNIHRNLMHSYFRKMLIERGSAASDPFADITLFDNDIYTMQMSDATWQNIITPPDTDELF